MEPLTARQGQVLDYITGHLSASGYPPTLREVAAHFGLSGPRAAVKHLEALERKGFIRRSPGSSRGIEVIRRRTPLRETVPAHAGAREVPVLGTVPAGPLDLALEEGGESLVLDPSLAAEGTFLLRVKGDSMTGDHILPGDLVLVRKQDTAANGDMVVVLVGEEATLKRFRREGGRVTLLPSNPAYRPLVMDGSGGEIRIVGKVRAVIRVTDRDGRIP